MEDENGDFILDSNGDKILIEKEVKPNWKASAWRLGRKFPKKWGKKSQGVLKIEEEQSYAIIVNFIRSSENR
ncbi:MAG: hypothetical protein A2381_13490 [Bdellovibrionales bacterium RIFOXYB1_FULL_37_110]|nr:MAG: hypothetical protein A2417_08150 [Bdellovibrionales bacterium RIFOXYC1_FULL_37_79]OFZ59459.1 MAG: hypothetical protein A2381_13490 [Bdellovibrionales bacterium RIFOXYB1_FULL_37_110]OFZ64306.1 MAG: hypothetical protein A2577_02615 [Bdellovibrionales bacterium RIFOXYD1_FULL_36_51]